MDVASESSTVRSLNMKFHEFGDKNLPPILLIHGGGSSWWNYLRQALSYVRNLVKKETCKNVVSISAKLYEYHVYEKMATGIG